MHLAKGLAELGHIVTVCCINTSTIDLRSLEEAGVKVVSLRAHTRLGRAAAVPRLVRLARRSEVVHCTMWDASLWGRLAAILARRPVIVADHATDRSIQVAANRAPRASWIALHNRLLDRFTFATVACATSQLGVLTGEEIDPRKIVHIPNGVPVDEIVRSAADGPTRRALGIPAGAAMAMQIGVFRAEKNQLGALEAFARAREHLGNAHLVFVGDGDTRGAVEHRAQELEADWTHFVGYRRDVPALLSLADAVLLPSLSDAMPMTTLEAMALGVPIVATDVGDVRKVVGGAGICVPAGDEEALSQACVRLLSDRELRSKLGRAGRERARTFDSSVMSRRYSALFEAACTGGAPSSAVPLATQMTDVGYPPT